MVQNELFGLKQTTLEKIRSVFLRYPEIKKVILYGSRAKGNYKNGSDIDITIIGDNLSYKIIFKLQDDLDELYLPYTFDINIFQSIDNPDLIEHITRVGKIFFLREEDTSINS